MSAKQTLDDLRTFAQQEQNANTAKLHEVWEKSLSSKLKSGQSQRICSITLEDRNRLVLQLGEGESRFREGDMICLHQGDATQTQILRQGTIEAENDGEWLIYARNIDKDKLQKYLSQPDNSDSAPENADLENVDLDKPLPNKIAKPLECYADPDGMDLKPFFDKALNEIANTRTGTDYLLPLLAGEVDTTYIYPENYDEAADIAEACNMNEQQIDAVAKGVAARHLACIQGPPGTGKTRVIGLIAKILIQEGQRVLVSSHTHTAINNALNSIAKAISENSRAEDSKIPVIKVGSIVAAKGLHKNIECYQQGDEWQERPDNGYVIGATPFATCTNRLENFEFDTLIFDEASQITPVLAIMAMRKAKRYIFVGDHKQLPPVVLSQSILDKSKHSVFTHLIANNSIADNTATSVMLTDTYRMNQELTQWPSQQYYQGQLVAAQGNAKRALKLLKRPPAREEILSKHQSFIYLQSPGFNARTVSKLEARWVAEIVNNAKRSGVSLEEIGVVTPFRAQARALKKALADSLGLFSAKSVICDTVERMQGQERELIIISLCATEVLFLQTLANFFFQQERLNVAITRARSKLILIGPSLPDNFTAGLREESDIANVNAYKSLIEAAHAGPKPSNHHSN